MTKEIDELCQDIEALIERKKLPLDNGFHKTLGQLRRGEMRDGNSGIAQYRTEVDRALELAGLNSVRARNLLI